MIIQPSSVLAKLSGERAEKQCGVFVFYLNQEKNCITIHKYLAKNTNKLSVSDIFSPAIYLGASFVIIAQLVLPLQQIIPNQMIKEYVQILSICGKSLAIPLLDYLIISKNKYYSFHESKYV